jgi:cell division protein FtsN
MAQDFAKQRQVAPPNRRNTVRAASRTAPESSRSHWNWFFSGIFCGFLVVGIGYLGIIKLDNELNQAVQIANTTDTPNRPTFDFGFYGELANAEINVPVPQSTPSAGNVQGRSTSETQAAITTQSVQLPQYMLQAGSFQDRQDAENRRAKLILLNMNASIAPGVVSGRTWHRVNVGPFMGKNAQESARELLSENNIDSIPLLVPERTQE